MSYLEKHELLCLYNSLDVANHTGGILNSKSKQQIILSRKSSGKTINSLFLLALYVCVCTQNDMTECLTLLRIVHRVIKRCACDIDITDFYLTMLVHKRHFITALMSKQFLLGCMTSIQDKDTKKQDLDKLVIIGGLDPYTTVRSD